ncbi:MocR-like B6 salvage transcription factor PtsJ [Pluralibacter gergoviae]
MLKSANEIFEYIRQQVRKGNYKPNDSLPPIRDLAEMLGVNRNTVSSAYQKLVVAGIATTRGRNGTVINQVTGDADREGFVSDMALIDVAGGNPGPEFLPDPILLARSIDSTPKLYGEASVSSGLRKIGKKWLNDGVPEEHELSVTHGAVDAVERLLRAYLIAGDRVVVEEPCFLSSISTIKTNGYKAVGVPVDEEGMNTALLSKALSRGAQAVIITPRAQNPTGWALSKERAGEIRDLLAKYPQVLIVVDDHFSLLSSSDYHSIIPADARHWALVRTVSKFFGPDLRVALMASDPETALRLQQRLSPGIGWVSHILQDMVQGGLSSPEVMEKIEYAKNEYWRRREKFTAELKRHGINISDKHGGLNVWIPLKNGSEQIVTEAMKKGWLLRSAEGFNVNKSAQGLRITISALSDGQIESLAEIVATLVKKFG